MSMDCIRSRGFDRLNLSRVFKHSKLNHGLFFLIGLLFFFFIFFMYVPNVNIAEWSKIKINDGSVLLRTSRCPFLGPPIAPFYDLLLPLLGPPTTPFKDIMTSGTPWWPWRLQRYDVIKDTISVI